MARRYDDDVSLYDDRRSTRSGRRVYDDRYEDVEYRRAPAPVRERETIVREEVRERERPGSVPAFMREDYGRTTAGPIVLRAREREDFEYAPRRRRSPSPEPEKKIEREEIIIRRDESGSRPPPRRREPPPQDIEREEIIIRRDEKDSRGPPAQSREREEIIIRRDEREARPPPPPPQSVVNASREEIIIRRDESDRRSRYDDYDDTRSRASDWDRRTVRGDIERDEVIIRREEATAPRRYDDYVLERPKSHERARSRGRRSSSASEQEIIIRKEEVEGKGGVKNERQEIIIRKSSRSRSRSPSSATSAPAPVPLAPPPQIINAPTIHQEVITHHRHIDHGFEVQYPMRPRTISRPPSPPSPPPAPAPAPASVRSRSEERIEISRSGTRNGRTYDEDIVISRNEGARSAAPPAREPYYDTPPRRDYAPVPYRGYDRDVQEEAEYYNNKALERAYIGEAYNGATRDWELVDVPPGTRRVRMDGAGGGAQEITWQRYNGVRRSKFMPEGSDEGYGSEVNRPAPARAPGPLAPLPQPSNGEIARRFGRERDPTEGLWTEVTKDLVVKEAIQEMGYEFEETDEFYYIMKYLQYEDIARLVGLSEDIRKERRKRIKEIEWENRVLPPPVEEPARAPLPIGPPPPRPQDRYDLEDERYIEREIIYRGGRPPPPVGWRR